MKDNFAISEETVEKILQKYNLGRLSTFKEVKIGLINPVFIINGQYVLRINTKNNFQSKQKFEKEAFLYTLFFQKSDIPTPECLAYDNSGEIIKEDYLLISYIMGETLTNTFKKANKEAKYRLAYQLGQIAKKIHFVDISKISSRRDLFGDVESWSKIIESEFTKHFDLIKERQLLSGKVIEGIEAVSKEFTYLGNFPEKITLIHGDFSCIVSPKQIDTTIGSM